MTWWSPTRSRADLVRIIAAQDRALIEARRDLEEARRALGLARANAAQAWAVVETLGKNLPQTVARAVVQVIMGKVD